MSAHTKPINLAHILSELRVRDLEGEFSAIARKHKVTLAELLGPGRTAAPCAARFECWYRLREWNWSYPRIGKLFDRDHTTIILGVRQHLRSLCKTAADEARKAGAA